MSFMPNAFNSSLDKLPASDLSQYGHRNVGNTPSFSLRQKVSPNFNLSNSQTGFGSPLVSGGGAAAMTSTAPSPEPMMLGSPGSPAGASHSQFLPGYLLGDTPLKSTSKPLSPGSLSTSRKLASPGSGSKGMLSGIRGSGSRVAEETRSREFSSKMADKPGAPPVQGLFDVSYGVSPAPPTGDNLDVSGRKSLQLPTSHIDRSEIFNSSHASFSSPAVVSFSANTGAKAAFSPTQADPFYTQGESLTPDDVLDDCWVTVFGFPVTAVRFVLQQFSRYGTILKHVVKNEGNWMHIRYNSKIQAKNALSKNGKVIGGNIMVGVRQCIDKEVMGGGDEAACTPSKQRRMTPGVTPSTPTSQNKRRSQPIRPLTAAYRAATVSREVNQGSRTPVKSSSGISKVMEYLLGW